MTVKESPTPPSYASQPPLRHAAAIAAQGIDRGTVDAMVRRINLSEYKRRQAAPGLKISSKAFGVGRRFPIAARFADP